MSFMILSMKKKQNFISSVLNINNRTEIGVKYSVILRALLELRIHEMCRIFL